MDNLKKGQNGDWAKEGYSLKHVPHAGGDESFFSVHAHDANGKKVGQADFTHHEDGKHIRSYDDGLNFQDAHVSVKIDNAHRRKGLATAMYQHAEKVTGKNLKNVGKNKRTEDGHALWNQTNRPFGTKMKKSEGSQIIFVAIDGDGIGNQVGRAALGNDVQGLHELSIRITRIQDILGSWAQSMGGTKISGGGDEGIVTVPADALSSVEALRKDIQFSLGFTVSVGVGDTLAHAATSLLIAKVRGKDQVATYDDSVVAEIEAAKQRVADGTATDEERKISAAYLEPKGDDMAQSEHDDCEYCKETEGNEDLAHCQYCHDAEQEDGHDDCEYCKEADQEGEDDHQHADGESCEYCDQAPSDPSEEEAAAEENDPTADSADDFADADLNPPAIPKPGDEVEAPGLAPDNEEPVSNSNMALENDAESEEGLAASPDESIYDADEHSSDAMSAIVSQLDGDSSETDADAMNNIDDADEPTGDNMEGSTSRPDGYGENTPADMGLAEDQDPNDGPDLSEVLQQGLDSHADNIQREKVVQMVGEALEGFKASKDVLERAKEQAPQLYQASLAMLKAMIEMAKMLGLDSEGSEDSEGPIGAQGDEVVAGMESEDDSASPEQREPAHFATPADEESEQAAPEQREPAHFAKPAESPSKGEAPGKKPVGQ